MSADEPEEDVAEEDVDAEAVDGEDGEDGEEGASSKKRKLSGKFMVLFIVLPVLLLGGGGYFAATYFGLLGGEPAADEEVVAAPPKKPIFYDLPEMLVNLTSQDSRSRYLKLKISLEMTDEEVKPLLEPLLPRLLDTFQVYLRELRTDDLEGSAGVYRLKEELARRINISIRPRKITRVLFREMLVQ